MRSERNSVRKGERLPVQRISIRRQAVRFFRQQEAAFDDADWAGIEGSVSSMHQHGADEWPVSVEECARISVDDVLERCKHIFVLRRVADEIRHVDRAKCIQIVITVIAFENQQREKFLHSLCAIGDAHLGEAAAFVVADQRSCFLQPQHAASAEDRSHKHRRTHSPLPLRVGE